MNTEHDRLTLAQKILIGAVVGALIGSISVFAQDRLSRHYIKKNGAKRLASGVK